MTTDSEKSWLDEETEAETSGSPSIEELMADGDGADVVELDQSAIRAAEQLLGDDGPGGEPGSQGLWSTDYDEDVDYGEDQPQGRSNSWLHGLLVLNIVLLGVMLALPGSRPPADKPEPAGYTPSAEGVAEPDPAWTQPPRELRLPTSELWEASVRAAGYGDYNRAAELLEHHLRVTPNVSDLERQLVYNQLAYYLVKDGKLKKSQEYSTRAQQLMARSYLPEDLLHSAKEASDSGDLVEMRSAYARFLLQMKQASPALRKARAEAFLKLGDSYREEANQSEMPGEAATEPPTGGHDPHGDAEKATSGHGGGNAPASEPSTEPHGGKGHG